MMRQWTWQVVTVALLLSSRGLAAQDRPPVRIARASGPIRLDGRVDEAAWQGAAVMPLIMNSPTSGAPATEASEIRLLYDDQYLYASGVFHVHDSRTIRPGLFTRDQMGGGDDHFMVILDAANDAQTGYVFAVTPSGSRIDWAVADDGAHLDRNWNGFWDAAATSDSAGWYAELRIPLSTLRFQSIGGTATMGLILHRYVAAASEFDTYPHLPANFANGLFRSSIAQKIELQGVDARSPLYVTPYVLGGRSSVATLAPGATDYERIGTATTEVGLDAKFGLTSSLAVDLTANTDFAQVEADNQQVNLTRFSLFFPEKRQFFLERADLFAVDGGQGDLLFHSRRIGLAPGGVPLRIYGGARIVGRAGGWDIGALSLQTATAGGATSENDAALRVRRGVINSGSTIGALATTRLDGEGRRDLLLSGDAVLRPFGNDFVTAQVAASDNSGAPAAAADARLSRLKWERRASAGLQYSAEVRQVGKAFDPALGFQSRSGIRDAMLFAGYGWRPGARTPFASITPSAMAYLVERTTDHVTDTRSYAAGVGVSFKSGWYVGTDLDRNLESIDQGFALSPTASIPAGEFDYSALSVSVSTNRRSTLSVNTTTTLGDFYDGTRRSLSVAPTWTPSAHLVLSVTGTIDRIRFPARDQSMDADFAKLRVQYALDARFSGAAFVQYNRVARTTAANMRLRWQMSEGRDLWLVYNDMLNMERDPVTAGAPERPRSQAHTLMVKYTQTFIR